MIRLGLRLITRIVLAVGLFSAGAFAGSRFPNLDRAQAELASALAHCQTAVRNVGPNFGGHMQAAMNHIGAAQSELAAARQAIE